MNFGDVGAGGWFWVIVSWVHAVAAVAWVGGSIFFALVLRPVAAANPELMRRFMGPIGGVYRELVDASIIALLVSGIILMFNRLTGDDATPAYFIVLGVKLAVALWMFYAVWQLRRSGFRPEPTRGVISEPDGDTMHEPGKGIMRRLSWLLGYNAVMAFGVIIFLLAGVLRALYEASVSR